MNIQRIYALVLRQLFLYKKSIPRLVGIFYWSTLELLIWGIITRYLEKTSDKSFGLLASILGAIIFWNFFTRMQHGIIVSFLEDIRSRNFINLFVSPLSITEYVTGLTAVSVLTTFCSIILMSVTAFFLFTYNILTLGIFILPFIAILFCFSISIGIFTTGLILRLGPSADVLIWSLPILIVAPASVFHPVSALPLLLQKIAWILPPAYVFEGMRAIVLNDTFVLNYIVIGGTLALFYCGLSVWFLRQTFRSALRSGTLAKFYTK